MKTQIEDLGRRRLRDAFSSRTAVVFCGAGVSLEPPAGLPDWIRLRDMTLESVISDNQFLQKFLRTLTDTPMLADPDGRSKGMTNEVVASMVAENTANYFDCFESLRVGRPNANHLCLARMAQQGYIHTIITTNWDLFIERAMDDVGIDYDTIRTEAEFAGFQPVAGSDRVRIVKLHGCLSKPTETIIATVEQEAQGLSPAKQRVLEGLLTEHLFVFWGYSGLDLKIHPDYLRMRTMIDQAKGFVWDAYDAPSQYVQELKNAYGERGTIVRRMLPGVLGHFISLPERVILSDDDWDHWQNQKNADIGKSLNAWARKNVDVFDAYLIVGSLLAHNGNTTDALACYQEMAQVATNWPNHRAHCLAVGRAGAMYKMLGEHAEALNAYQEATTGFRQLGDSRNVYHGLNHIAALHTVLGNYGHALAHYEEAEHIARQHSLPDGLGVVFEGLGELYKDRGKAEEALTYYEQALDEFTVQGDQRSEARVSEKVGVLYRNWGQLQEALSHFRRAESVYRALGLRVGLATALRNTGSIELLSQHMEAAERHLHEASELASLTGDKRLLSAIYSDQALLAGNQDNREKGRLYAERAISFYRELGDQRSLAIALNNLAGFAPETGVTYQVEALELLEQIGDHQTAAVIGELIGDHYRTTLNDIDTAQSYYERAMMHFDSAELYPHIQEVQCKIDLCKKVITERESEAIQNLVELADAAESAGEYIRVDLAHYQIGELYESQQSWEQALEHYRLAEHAARVAEYRLGVGLDLFKIGVMSHHLGRYEDALEAYRGAQEIHEDNPNRSKLGNTLLMMGNAYAAMGDLQNAIAAVDQALRTAAEAESRQGMLACLHWFVSLYEHIGDTEQTKKYRQLEAQIAQSNSPG